MSKNTILMPVIAICDECKDCPSLSIEVSSNTYYGLEDTVNKNTLYCEHYEMCKHILSTTLAKNNYNKYNSTNSD